MKKTLIAGVILIACAASAFAVFGSADPSDGEAVDSADVVLSASGPARGNTMLTFRLGEQQAFSVLCVAGKFHVFHRTEGEQNEDRQKGRLRTAHHSRYELSSIDQFEASGSLQPDSTGKHLLLTCQGKRPPEPGLTVVLG